MRSYWSRALQPLWRDCQNFSNLDYHTVRRLLPSPNSQIRQLALSESTCCFQPTSLFRRFQQRHKGARRVGGPPGEEGALSRAQRTRPSPSALHLCFSHKFGATNTTKQFTAERALVWPGEGGGGGQSPKRPTNHAKQPFIHAFSNMDCRLDFIFAEWSARPMFRFMEKVLLGYLLCGRSSRKYFRGQDRDPDPVTFTVEQFRIRLSAS